MATSYKYLTNNDRVVMSSPLVEDQLVVSGTTFNLVATSSYFATAHSQSTDNPAVFNVTFGKTINTTSASNVASVQAVKDAALVKEQIYYQMGKLLLGYDGNSNIRKFNTDKDTNDATDILHNAFFLNIPRNTFKDYIQPGTFRAVIDSETGKEVTLSDLSSSQVKYLTAQTGRVGVLYASGTIANFNITQANEVQGYIFYEAGIAAISPYIFAESGSAAAGANEQSSSYINKNPHGILSSPGPNNFSGSAGPLGNMISGSSTAADLGRGFAARVKEIGFNSVTELNSTVYFCRAYNNEFNYSSNPTYLSGSEIIVKDGEPTNPPISYITTVGLYDDNNQLLAVAKLSEPIKKTPETELIARVRLDF
jgi:hypothetical protein